MVLERLSPTLAGLWLALLSACSATGVQVVYHDTHARSFGADVHATRAAVFDALAGLEFEVTTAGKTVIARSPAESRFFSLIGKREKRREVTLRFSDGPYWTRVDVEPAIVHGTPGSSHADRKADDDEVWLALFFDRVCAAFGDR